MAEQKVVQLPDRISEILGAPDLGGVVLSLKGVPKGLVEIPDSYRRESHFVGYYGTLNQDNNSLPFHITCRAGFPESELINLARLKTAVQDGQEIVLEGRLRVPSEQIEGVPYVLDVTTIFIKYNP